MPMCKCSLEAFSGVNIVLGAFRSKRTWRPKGTCNCGRGLPDSCKLAFGLHGTGEIKLRLRNIGCQRTPIMDIGLDLKAHIGIGGYKVKYNKHFTVWQDTAIGSRWNC